MTTIDTRGRACPEPLILTRRAIAGAEAGSRFEVLSDNATARGNLLSYLASMGLAAECTLADGIYRITFAIDGTAVGRLAAAPGSATPQAVPASPEIPHQACACGPDRPGYAVVIRGNAMGSGDDTLGALLLRACVNSLGELDTPPAAIVLYNGGVRLAVRGTDTAASLAALAARGVRILVCGTCVDYFGLGTEIAVGTISNMFTINETLARASHVLYP